MRKVLMLAALAPLLWGCASSSKEVTAAYVSPYQYEPLNCAQLADEAGRLSNRAAQAAGAQDSKAAKDAVATGVALIVFWPAAFFVGGNDQNAAELARLKGEMDALEQVATRKRCGIQFNRAPPSAG